jgi:hypothetical protein
VKGLKLYKYMTLSSCIRLLTNPALQISHPGCLNDPFELKITKKDSTALGTVLETAHGRAKSFAEYRRHFWSDGVVCMTQTHDNLLMWSHYTKDHQGAVVEFDLADDPFSLFLNPSQGTTDSQVAGNVDYRKSREFGKLVNIENLDSLRKHYALTKSVEWTYEEEYRFVLHHSQADFLLLDSKKEIFPLLCNDLGLDRSKLELIDGKLSIDLTKNSPGSELLQKVWCMYRQAGAVFLKVVDPRTISRIYLGCQVDAIDFQNHLKQTPLYQLNTVQPGTFNPEVQTARISDSEFKLEFSPYSFANQFLN